MKPVLGVLGGGEMGLAVAAGFAGRGFSVLLLESGRPRFQSLAEGSFFSSEQELAETFNRLKAAGMISLTRDPSRLGNTRFVFFCAEPTGLWQTVAEIAPYLQEEAGLVICRTVPVGTGDAVQEWLDQQRKKVEVISWPQFLRSGKTWEDVRSPARVILGGNGDHCSIKELRKLLADHMLPIMLTTRRNAEMIKYTADAFLATKISFINQIARLCEPLGTDVQTVSRGIGLDPRIGQACLAAGIGFGGPGLPEALLSLLEQAGRQGRQAPLLEAVKKINEEQQNWPLDMLKSRLDTLEGKVVAVWGVTFKGGTEKIVHSPAIPVMERLLAEKATLQIFDPLGMKRLQKQWDERGLTGSYRGQIKWSEHKMAALEQADALLILADWLEFKEADLSAVKSRLNRPLLVDGRNLFPPKMMKGLGFDYLSVGRKV